MILNRLNQYKYFDVFQDQPIDMAGYISAVRSFEENFGFEKYTRRSESGWRDWREERGTWLLLYHRSLCEQSLERMMKPTGRLQRNHFQYIDSLMVLRELEDAPTFSVEEKCVATPAFAAVRISRTSSSGRGIGLDTKASTTEYWKPYGSRYPSDLRPVGVLTNKALVEVLTEGELRYELEHLLFEAWITDES